MRGIREGIAYLAALGREGKGCGAAGKACARVSCTRGAAIWVCDEVNTFFLPSLI